MKRENPPVNRSTRNYLATYKEINAEPEVRFAVSNGRKKRHNHSNLKQQRKPFAAVNTEVSILIAVEVWGGNIEKDWHGAAEKERATALTGWTT